MTPTSQQDEESRIATLAYALKKLGNSEDAAEFMRCLNTIYEEGDARYRQVAASYYYKEISERGAGPVLKEMALLAMQLASLNLVTEEAESDSEAIYALYAESKPRSLFDLEVAEVARLIRGRRKNACFARDEWTEWLNDLEANWASLSRALTARQLAHDCHTQIPVTWPWGEMRDWPDARGDRSSVSARTTATLSYHVRQVFGSKRSVTLLMINCLNGYGLYTGIGRETRHRRTAR